MASAVPEAVRLPSAPEGEPGWVWAPCAYDAQMRQIIIAFKERGCPGLASPLGLLAAICLLRLVSPPAAPLFVVPVPTARRRVRARGYDHTALLAREVAAVSRRWGINAHVWRGLDLTRDVADQSTLSAADRALNLAGAFRANRTTLPTWAREVDHTTLVLVDDIVTTGATFREAKRALTATAWPGPLQLAGVAAAAVP